MKKLLHLLLFVCVLAVFVVGCKKDSEEETPDLKDRWEKVSPPELDFVLSYSYGNIFLKQNNEIFFVDAHYTSIKHCWCGTENQDEWQQFTIDSANNNSGYVQLYRQDQQDNIWVLLETRLIKITGCGSYQSYEIANRDTFFPSPFENRFWDMEIIDGVPWITHDTWGVYRFDIETETLIKETVFPHYGDDEVTFGINSSIGGGGSDVLFSNQEGKLWRYQPALGFLPTTVVACEDCRFYGLRLAPNGETIAHVYRVNGTDEWVNISDYFKPVPTMPMNESPNYFSKTVLDRASQFAYHSSLPIPESYVGYRPLGDAEHLTVDVKDAVEEGSVLVRHIGFSTSNELYVATDRGIFKYLGRDE